MEVGHDSRQMDAAVMAFIALGKDLSKTDGRPRIEYVPAHRPGEDCS